MVCGSPGFWIFHKKSSPNLGDSHEESKDRNLRDSNGVEEVQPVGLVRGGDDDYDISLICYILCSF